MLYKYYKNETILVYREPTLRKLKIYKDSIHPTEYNRKRENYYYYILLHLKPHKSNDDIVDKKLKNND